ncbi:MAG: GNAT family N-acetyltransferase [Syntrophobacteraceae bacterium]
MRQYPEPVDLEHDLPIGAEQARNRLLSSGYDSVVSDFNMSRESSLSLRIINSLSNLEEVKALWETWQINPNSDFELFQLVCRSRREVKSPYVMVLERNGFPRAILCARLENTSFAPRIGYFRPLKIPAAVLTVIHSGLLGNLDSSTARRVVEHLWSLLASGGADAVTFHSLSEYSPLMLALLDHAPAWWCEKKPVWTTHRTMALGNEPGFMLKNQKSDHRRRIKKKQRELESAFPDKVLWKWMDRFDDVSELCAKLEMLAARTYQRALGSGFIDNEEYRKRFCIFAGRGQLRMQLLEIEGKIRAFNIGSVHRGVFYDWVMGYDPDLREYVPGTLVLFRLVDELIREGVRKFDFGLGDAHYKQRYGDESWDEADVTMFAPSPKGFALRFVFGFCAVIDGLSRRFLQRTGLLDRVKTGWRKRLSGW